MKRPEYVEQFVLEALISDGGGRFPAAVMVPVTTRGARFRIVAGGEPLLRQVPQSQIVGSAASPILVGTQPGSTALLNTSGHSRATAAASVVAKSLLSEISRRHGFRASPFRSGSVVRRGASRC